MPREETNQRDLASLDPRTKQKSDNAIANRDNPANNASTENVTGLQLR
jgi:hypothetical protein